MKFYLICTLLIFFSATSLSAQLEHSVPTAEQTLSKDPAVGKAGLSEPINFTSVITQLNATTTAGDQINPSVAALPSNQFVMTWSDRASNDGDRGGIFGRIYDETLTPLTSEFLVNTLTSDWQSKSNIASAPNGNFMAIWHQANGFVEGQLFDATGVKLGAQFTVQEGFNGLSDVVADATGNFWVVSTVNNGAGYINKYSNTGELLVDSKVYQSEVIASDPVITALSDGRVLVSWYDGQNPAGSDIYGQYVTSAGELAGAPFVVNTTLAENQSKPAIAGLASGGFVVAWQSLLQDGDLAGVYTRLFDIAGVGGSEILVNTSTAGNQVNAYVMARADGGFVVGWVDSAAAPQGQVYLQSYTKDGELQGVNQVVSVDDVNTINNSENIEFAELRDGSLVAVWNAWRGSQNIYGRTFSVRSVEVEPPLKTVGFTSVITQLNATTTAGDQINPSVAALPSNQFVMTWSDRASNDGDRGGIFGRIYDETLTPLTSEFLVNTLTSDWQSKSNIASAPNGNFMAIWHQANGFVEGQLFDATGVKLGAQFTVQEGFNGLSDVVADATGNFWVVSTVNNGAGYINKYSNTGELLVDSKVYQSEVIASDPVITALSDGRVLVSWYDGQNPAGSDIYGQYVTSAGELAGAPFVVNTTLAENQSKPAIAGLASGGFVVAWQSLLQDGDLAGVYTRLFDIAGVGGSEILVNTSTAGNQVNAYVMARADGGFVVGWVDSAAAPQGQVYLQSYTKDGELQGVNQVVSVDDVNTINNSENIEFAELRDGSLVAVWNAWRGSQNIYGRTFSVRSVEVEPPLKTVGFTSVITQLNATTTAGDQINPSVAALPSNQFVMTWSDRASNDGDRGGIFGRIYDETLTPLTSEFLVNTLTSDWQSKSNIASAPNGNFMAIWHQANGFVEGQLFDATGVKLGAQFTVQEGFNGLSDVVADATGNFWVVSTVNNGAGYINKYSNTGELLVDSKVYQSEVIASDPVITALSDGRVLVSWYDGQNPAGSDIYGQYVTSAGELAGAPFVVNTTLAENQSKPAIAGLASGGFVVAWQSLLQDGDLAGVYTRLFDIAGVGGSEILVNTSTAGNQVNAYVMARADGGFVVGWVDSAAAPQGQVYLQSYTKDGELQGVNQVVSVDDVNTINNSENIEFAELRDGSLVAVWNAWRGSQNIYGRTFELNTIVGTDDDSDGDGVLDINDAFPNDPSETTDTDSDGIGNNADPDDDGDGVLDIRDGFKLISLDGRIDTDGDGYPDDCDADCQLTGMSADDDDDGDGVIDLDDAFPLDPNETTDMDGDGVGANADLDDNDPAVGKAGLSEPINFTSVITQLNATTTAGDQINPSVAALPSNQFVMTWSDRASNDGDRGGIFGRIYDETLTPLTSEFLVNTLTSDWQSKSNIASAPNGNFMAIWHQANGFVEGQLFDATGVKLGAQFTVQEGFNGLSDVVADATGNFWVVSTVNNGAGYINKYSNTGELLVDSKVYQSEVIASDPVITALSDGRVLVSWYDGQNPAGSDIYGQYVTSAGELAGAPFVVNTTLAENQSKPAIAGLASGGFVVAWQSLLQDGDLAGVYTRLFDIAGVGGSEILVNTSTAGNQVNAYVMARADGGFVVGWVDSAAAPQGQVYLQSYTKDGELQGVNQVVSVDDVNTINNSENIEFAELRDGSLVAVWNAWRGSQNIYGRTFSVRSVEVEPPLKTVGFTSVITQLNATTTAGDQINPSVAALPSNQFVMTWSDRASNDGDRGGIFGRIYDETLTPLTSEFLVNTLTSDWQSKSNIASAPNGNFMAIWHQANGFVEGQLFDATGVKLGAQFTVQEGFNGLSDVVADATGNFWVVSTVNNGAGYINKYSNTGELLVDSKVYQSEVIASDPVITALSDGRVLVSWYDGQNPAGSDIYGQYVTSAGELAGAPFVVNTTLAENQSKPAIAGLASGGFVVAWQSLLQDGDLAGVYTRLFDIAGVGGSEILVNTSTAGNQVNAYVMARADGGFVVGWVDSAAAPQGQVYLQSYTKDGELQGVNQVVSVDDVNTINNSENIEFAELRDGSLVAVWNAWRGSQNIYGRTFELNTIVGTDDDSDGDGVLDINDAFPNDPSETTDTDSDGIGNNADPDDDGDGVLDVDDAYPLDSSRSVDAPNTAPTIAIEGLATMTLNVGETWNDPGALAVDDEDGDLTASVIVINPIDSSTPGSYTMEYRVTDSSGITSTVTRTVTVIQPLSSGAVRFAAGQVIELPVIGTALTAPNGDALVVPTTATAASINVTGVSPGGSGFITVWPCGVARPVASNLNYVAGDVVPNGVLAPIGSNGKVCIYSLVDTDLVVDVAGWFEGDAFVGATPLRLRDTRETSRVTSTQELVLQVADIDASTADGSATRVPADVGAVALNVTVVSPDSAGFVTVYPCGTRPLASNVNYTAGQIVPNGVIAPVSADGKVCIYSLAPTDIIVDLAGWFPGDAFTAATPQRLVDTRDGTGGQQGKLIPTGQLNVPVHGQTLSVSGNSAQVPLSATAAALNVTIVNPESAGFATVWPCSAERPLASNLNFVSGQVVANNVIAPIGDQGSVCFYTNVPSDIIVDIAGYFSGEAGNQFVGSTPKRYIDTRSSLGPVPE